MVGRTLEKGWTGTLRAEAGRLLAPVVGKVRKKLQCAEHNNKAAIRRIIWEYVSSPLPPPCRYEYMMSPFSPRGWQCLRPDLAPTNTEKAPKCQQEERLSSDDRGAQTSFQKRCPDNVKRVVLQRYSSDSEV